MIMAKTFIVKEVNLSKTASLREVYGQTLVKLGEKHSDIVALSADLAGSVRLDLFAKKFPERFFNMGISEQDMIGTAAGLARAGKHPFVSTFAIFQTGRCWEQIRQSISYPGLKVKLVASHGGITVGADGGSHHCTEDISLMRTIPGMKVIVPSDAVETKKVIEEIVKLNCPVYVRLSRINFPVLFESSTSEKEFSFSLGEGVIVREGKDGTIIANGIMLSRALIAADKLASESGLKPMVVNMSSVKPIDETLIVDCARETGAILTAEEHSIIGGLGSAVCEVVAEKHPCKVKRIGVEDRFGISGSPDDLMREYGLTAENIASKFKELFK